LKKPGKKVLSKTTTRGWGKGSILASHERSRHTGKGGPVESCKKELRGRWTAFLAIPKIELVENKQFKHDAKPKGSDLGGQNYFGTRARELKKAEND